MTKRTYDEEIRQALAHGHAGTREVDLAATAWQGGRRRRTRRRVGTGTGVTALVAAAAATAFALGGGLTPEAFDPGPAEEPAPTEVPTERPDPSTGSDLVPEGYVTLVFHRSGTEGTGLLNEPPVVPTPEDLAGTGWELAASTPSGAEWGVTTSIDEPQTSLSFGEAPARTFRLLIEGCGEAVGNWSVDPGGALDVNSLGSGDRGCPALAQQAEDFWMEGLAGGGVLQVAGDSLLFSVPLPEDAAWAPWDEEPDVAPEAVDAVGPGVAVDLPEGWTVVHRGELEEGVHTSCAVPQGRGTDPTVQCDGIEFTVGLGEEPRPAGTEFFRAGVDQPIPCYADPAWRDQDPAANPAEVEPAGGGGVQVEGRPDADTESWSGRCADGQRFYPESWWWADGGVLATSLTGDPAVEELASTLDFYADTGDLVTQDAVVGSMDGGEVALDVFEPGDGPVGSGATPTGSAAYRLTEQTQCHLHDLQGPSGLDLSIVDCAELLDWLAGEVSADREPLVTVIADDQDRLVQIRTLYTP
ncbi:MAG: hypothetical protein M3520_06205 [Actinomycetota bacterium]|nr:hypothetical protein [Actinomycetota bacterium]